nr:MAG TPA: hypothetical protein [Caudoviricetes sp.]
MNFYKKQKFFCFSEEKKKLSKKKNSIFQATLSYLR